MSTRRVLLGLFIVWQLIFIVGTNFNDLAWYMPRQLPEDWKGSVNVVARGWQNNRGHISEVSNTFGDISGRYIHLTGQEQIWSLFSPGGWRDSSFIAVELRWDDAPPVMLYSANEPESVERFVRWGKCRLRRVEGQFDLYLSTRGQTEKQYAPRWAARIEEHVQASNAALRAYLQWRCKDYLDTHPGTAAPRQVILHVRRFHFPELELADVEWQGADLLPFSLPDQIWMNPGPPYLEGPFASPLACWRPETAVARGYLPVEAYDPVSKQFVPLKAQK